MEELIEENMGLVLSIVNKFNPKNSTEKDAYIQAGRIGLWKALTKYSKNGGSKFSPYAWNPIRWEIIKEIRSSKAKTPNLSVGDYVDFDHEAKSHSQSPFWELIPASLSQKESQVIQLRLEGYNFKEISAKLDCNRSHIKQIFRAAITKIRETNNE